MSTTDHICTLWRVVAKDGTAVSVCNFESDITYQDVTYLALPVEPTEFQTASGLSPDNAELSIPLVAPFTRENLLGGKWRGARITIQEIDFSDLTAPPIRRRTGFWGEVSTNEHIAVPQFRGLSQILNQPIGGIYRETCPYALGDEDCKKDLTAFTFTGTVTAVTDEQRFTVSVVKADNYFHKGKITFTSGANDGLTEEIWANDDASLTLFKPMIGVVAIGDTVTLIAGDDKTLATCKNKFANVVNFGGFPHLPGRTRVFTYPS